MNNFCTEIQSQYVLTAGLPCKAPLDKGFVSRLKNCLCNQDLFKLVEQNGFICPDAFNEVLARKLYQDYLEWKKVQEYLC